MERAGLFGNLGKNIVVVVSLLAAGFFAAWLRYQPHLGTEGSYTDGVRQYDSFAGEPIRFAVWEEPVALAGEVNSEEGEHAPTLSPDGRWLVFVGGERGRNAELWIAEMVAGETRGARPLYELNTRFDDLAPAFGQDALYFASNRPGGPGGFDLWRVPFAEGEFAEPELLGNNINTPKDEIDPAPLPGGTALAFASNRNTAGRQGHDLYLARASLEGGFDVEALEALNSYADDRELAFTSDGRRVFFASDRENERNSFDLFSSLFEGGAWLPPRAVEGLNSAASERAPTPTQDGFGLLFEKRELAAAGDVISADLFGARSLEVFQRPGPKVGWIDLLILIALLVLALLAALAKRWETIEVLYKCFLVSVIAHAALLWWFRDIHPEAEIAALPERGPTYQVSLAANTRNAAASSKERGGRTEAEADTEARELTTPERRAVAASRALPESAPSAAQVARRSGAEVDVPEAREAEAVRAAAEIVTASELKDAPTITRQAVGLVPSLAIGLPQPGVRAERTTQELSTPDRQELLVAQALPVSASEFDVERQAPTGAPDLPEPREDSEHLPEPASTTVDGDLARGAEVRTPLDFEQPELGGSSSLVEESDALASLQPSTRSEARRGAESQSMQRRAVDESSRELALEASPTEWTPSSRPERRRVDEPVLAFASTSPRVVEGPRESSLPRGDEPLREPTAGEVERIPLQASATESSSPLAPLSTTAALSSRSAKETPELVSTRRPASTRRLDALPEPKRAVFDTDARIVEERAVVAVTSEFEHTPYRTRFGPAKARALEEHGGSQETEAAVASGLGYLASIQDERGFWGDPRNNHEKYGHVFVGKTGLALLAFLGAGHTQESRTEHSLTVERALSFLVGVQRNDSGHFGRTSAYSHGIATYALAENYALTSDKRLREPLERAVAHILEHQNRDRRDARRFGGWSYYYTNDRTFDSWPRISITAWQVMALESARLGGVRVPDQAFDDARRFLQGALDQDRGIFRYSHDPDRLRGAYAILPGSTPAALFALSLLGQDLEDDALDQAWRFVDRRSPADYRYTSDNDFVENAQGNLYFWYYGSLACLRKGGGTWNRWNVRLKETLLESQRADGSWRPISIYAKDYAADNRDDASYSTAMNVLSLEVYYRYFTPLLNVGHGASSEGARGQRAR